MKISTKGRYALRLMLDLAMDETGEYVTVKHFRSDRASRENTWNKSLSALTKAGYVKSSRGAQGGYKLARPAEEYTVGSILRLIEGSLSPVACLDENLIAALAVQSVQRLIFGAASIKQSEMLLTIRPLPIS